jgi:HEAT repeat protein
MHRFLVIGLLLAAPTVALGQPEATYRGQPVAHWVAALADDDLRARWYATYALGRIGPEAVEAVEPLSEIVEDRFGHEYVRGGAAWALGRIGPGAESAVPRLIATLKSKPMPVVSVRRTVPVALGKIGPAAKPAVPGLVGLLGDADWGVRVNAAAALWRIDRHARAIPALVDMLRFSTGTGPYKAAVALGSLGPEAEPAVAGLIGALRHTDADVRRAAARARGQNCPAALAALEEALTDPDESTRRYAVEALGWIGQPAVPALIEVLGNDNAQGRLTAARALGRLGPEAKSAAPALLESVDDADPEVRAAAAAALGQIGGVAEGEPSDVVPRTE